MFAPTYLNAADSKPDNRFLPSDPVPYLGHTGVLPPHTESFGQALAIFRIDDQFLE